MTEKSPPGSTQSRPALERGASTVSQSKRPALSRALSTLSSGSSRSGGRAPFLRGLSQVSSSKSGTGTIGGKAGEKKSVFRQILSFFGHLSLILMIALYTALGGYIFVKLESPNEIKVDAAIRKDWNVSKQAFFDIMWKYTEDVVVLQHCNRTLTNNERLEIGRILNNVLREEIKNYEKFIYEAASVKVDVRGDSEFGWNYAKAMFFSATVITTIGYGNIAPVTINGRIFCIVYAILGIPLTLIVVADLGKLFARFVKYVYKKFKIMMKARLEAKKAAKKAKDEEDAKKDPGKQSKTLGTTQTTEEANPPKVNRTHQSLKVLGALTLLLVYIYFGATLFIIWERWDLFESFYFCFITMTTIGLGDVVPEHPNFMLLCTVYILIGLALTSTCIELARSEYEKSWQHMVEASKRLQGLSGVNLADALKKLGDHIEMHGDIIDLDLLRDLKNAVSGVSDRDDENENKPPPFIVYETTV